MTNERRIAMAVDRAVTKLGLAQMVELSEVPRRTVQNHAAGVCAPSVPALLAYVAACDEAGHPEVAAELLDAVLGTVGRRAALVPVACPERAPSLLAMHVSAETGDVLRWAEDALRDGVIDYQVAAQGTKELRDLAHAADELAAVVAGAELRTPQRALGLGSVA